MGRFFPISICLLLILIHAEGSPQPADARAFTYSGASDASGAALLNRDEFVVASDERTSDKRNVLLVYKTGVSNPIKEVSLTGMLATQDPSSGSPEADIEGSRIYWIGSHGHTSKGKQAPGRQVFFAIDIRPDGELTVVGVAHRGLIGEMARKRKLAKLAALDETELAPESGGLNIEGLCATADGSLLIGLRSPLHKSRATLIPLKNPAAVVEGKHKPKLGKPIHLDLRGKGIRDIAYDPQLRLFVILAGESGPGGASELFSWSGKARDQPVVILAEIPGDFAAESLVIRTDERRVTIFSDDGDLQFRQSDRSTAKNKDLPDEQRRFRSVSFALP